MININMPRVPIPLTGIIYIKSFNSLAIVLRLNGKKISAVLITRKGLQFKSMVHVDASDILDATPILKSFVDENIVGEVDALCLAIAVAYSDAASLLLKKCVLNRRVFPWAMIIPDIFLRSAMVTSSHHSSERAYDDAYRNISYVLVDRNTIGCMVEISRADEWFKVNNSMLNPAVFEAFMRSRFPDIIPELASPTASCAATHSSDRTHKGRHANNFLRDFEKSGPPKSSGKRPRVEHHSSHWLAEEGEEEEGEMEEMPSQVPRLS